MSSTTKTEIKKKDISEDNINPKLYHFVKDMLPPLPRRRYDTPYHEDNLYPLDPDYKFEYAVSSGPLASGAAKPAETKADAPAAKAEEKKADAAPAAAAKKGLMQLRTSGVKRYFDGGFNDQVSSFVDDAIYEEPEKVSVLEPEVYQARANNNKPNPRTTFYESA